MVGVEVVVGVEVGVGVVVGVGVGVVVGVGGVVVVVVEVVVGVGVEVGVVVEVVVEVEVGVVVEVVVEVGVGVEVVSAIPLQRSKAYLEEQGWKCWKTETFNQWSGRRVDLFHFADMICIRADVEGCLAVQCCSGDAAAHVKRYLEGWTDAQGKVYGPNEYLPIWKAGGNKFLIHSWMKQGAHGKRKVWTLRTVEL